jgi:small GTP-binding protein
VEEGQPAAFDEVGGKHVDCEVEEEDEGLEGERFLFHQLANYYQLLCTPLSSAAASTPPSTKSCCSETPAPARAPSSTASSTATTTTRTRYFPQHPAHRRHRLPQQERRLRKYNSRHADKPYRLQLWDTAGQEKYKSLVPAYLRDAHCGLLVFEVPRKESFHNLRGWLALFHEHAPDHAVILLLANKSDASELAACEYAAEVQSFLKEEQVACIETSAKSGLNINLVFETMIGKL